MIESIRNDLYRRYGRKKFGLIELLKIYQIPQVKIVKMKRKADAYRNRNGLLFCFYSFIYQRCKIKYNVDIPASTSIGKGFLLEHIGGITINPDTVIGDNCAIYNGVTIGVEKRGIRKGVPRIGNCVWIGANAIIVGAISIGDNVLIAPGAFVNFDVPNDSIVIGNPGHIIPSNNATESYIQNVII